MDVLKFPNLTEICAYIWAPAQKKFIVMKLLTFLSISSAKDTLHQFTPFWHPGPVIFNLFNVLSTVICLVLDEC